MKEPIDRVEFAELSTLEYQLNINQRGSITNNEVCQREKNLSSRGRTIH
jgi:hypothetical protein